MSPCTVEEINAQGFFVPYDPQTAASSEGDTTAATDDTASKQANGQGLRDDFMWGFATAAAQIEGGGKEKEEASGRGRSVSGSSLYPSCWLALHPLTQEGMHWKELCSSCRPFRHWAFPEPERDGQGWS